MKVTLDAAAMFCCRKTSLLTQQLGRTKRLAWCVVILGVGCDGVELQRQSTSPGTAQAAMFAAVPDPTQPPGQRAPVLLLELQPKGVLTAGKEEREVLAAAINHLDKGANSVKSITIIAWAVKGNILSVPPRLSEEAVVLVEWENPRKWSLFHLRRVVARMTIERGGWELGPTDYSKHMRASESFSRHPSPEQTLSFFKATNFGNNELSEYLVVIAVMLYDQRNQALLDFLQTGLPLEERRARQGRLEDAIAEPFDPPL